MIQKKISNFMDKNFPYVAMAILVAVYIIIMFKQLNYNSPSPKLDYGNSSMSHYIVDELGIERKCVKTTVYVTREIYTDENGRSVLVIDKIKE